MSHKEDKETVKVETKQDDSKDQEKKEEKETGTVNMKELDDSTIDSAPESGLLMTILFFTKPFYLWFTPYIWKGFRKTLTINDIPKLSDDCRVENNEVKFDFIWKKLKGWKFRLFLCLQYCFGLEFWFAGCIQCVGSMVLVLTPKVMEKFLKNLAPLETTEISGYVDLARNILPPNLHPPSDLPFRTNDWEIWLWLLLMIFLNTLNVIITHYTIHLTTKVGLKTRALLVAKIFQKTLRMNNKSRASFENGTIMNYVSKDTAKVERIHIFFHFGFSSFLTIGFSIYFLVDLIDWAAVTGLLANFIIVPVFIIVMIFVFQYLRKIFAISDERITKINEVCQGIKIIKFFTWEIPYLNKISKLRGKEITYFRIVLLGFSLIVSVMICTPVMISMVAFITYYGIHGHLDPVTVFTSLSYFNLLRWPLTLLPMVMVATLEMFVSLGRIEKMLISEDLEDQVRFESEENSVVIEDGFFEWEAPKKKKDDKKKKKKKKEKVKFMQKLKNFWLMIKFMCKKWWNGLKNWTLKKLDQVKMIAYKLVRKKIEKEEEEIELKDRKDIGKLDDINIKLSKGSFTVIVGGVGSGKSSLCAAILGEMKKKSGNVEVSGSIAYCSQTSWIMNATLKDNVSFGRKLKGKNAEKLFREVCDMTALTHDLENLPGRELIEIGEKGINLSGGQKYRVSLARACYQDADIYMLDDPLAAVDAHVGRHIFDNCIMGSLAEKTRILVTHQLQFVSKADHIIMMEKGRIVEQGTFEELNSIQDGKFKEYTHKHISKMKEVEKAVVKKKGAKKKEATHVGIIAREDRAKGAISYKVILAYCSACGGIPAIIIVGVAFFVAQFILTANDWFLSEWTNGTFNKKFGNDFRTQFYIPYINGTNHTQPPASYRWYQPYQCGHLCETETNWTLVEGTNNSYCSFCDNITLPNPPHQGNYTTGVCDNCQYTYVTTVGNEISCPLSGTEGECMDLLVEISWDRSYENEVVERKGLSQIGSVIIYGCIGLVALVIFFFRDVIFEMFALNASKNLHKRALENILRAPQSFFDTTPVGRIINRFSGDVSMIDFRLVRVLDSFLTLLFQVTGFMIIMVYATNGFFLLAVPIFAVAYFVVYYIYRKSAIEIKRLDSISKSPLIAHVGETLNGTATIRAFKQVSRFIQDNKRKIDINNRCYFLMMASQRWLAVNLQYLGSLIIFMVCGTCILLQYYAPDSWNIEVSYIALAITYSLSLSYLLGAIVTQMTECEVMMNSVERLNYYAKSVKNEKDAVIPAKDPPKSWPQNGKIIFKDYSMRYRENLPLVLKNISLEILPKEKIGIIGRTGSGKTSLMLALFRIMEPASGTMVIDDVDISEIGIRTLRSRLSIIPQDPVLFSGTIKSNLDPFNYYQEEEIFEALSKAKLIEKVKGLEDELEADVTEHGENFSVGERQLLCLARAILQDSKILILDECTASVDLETDRKIQETIRTQFKECTVLTIAHRLNTIIDSDRVLALDDGEVGEFGTPRDLIVNKDDYKIFRELILETGINNARLLFENALSEETDEIEEILAEIKEKEKEVFEEEIIISVDDEEEEEEGEEEEEEEEEGEDEYGIDLDEIGTVKYEEEPKYELKKKEGFYECEICREKFEHETDFYKHTFLEHPDNLRDFDLDTLMNQNWMN